MKNNKKQSVLYFIIIVVMLIAYATLIWLNYCYPTSVFICHGRMVMGPFTLAAFLFMAEVKSKKLFDLVERVFLVIATIDFAFNDSTMLALSVIFIIARFISSSKSKKVVNNLKYKFIIIAATLEMLSVLFIYGVFEKRSLVAIGLVGIMPEIILVVVAIFTLIPYEGKKVLTAICFGIQVVLIGSFVGGIYINKQPSYYTGDNIEEQKLFYIVDARTKEALTVNGYYVTFEPLRYTTDQRFYVVKGVAEGSYRIESVVNQYSLDVNKGIYDNGIYVDVYNNSGQEWQLWYIGHDIDRNCRIYAYNTDFSLTNAHLENKYLSLIANVINENGLFVLQKDYSRYWYVGYICNGNGNKTIIMCIAISIVLIAMEFRKDIRSQES